MPFDYAGLGIFFPAVVLLLAAISFGADLGWSSPLIIGLLLAAVVLAGWFIRHERAESDPMMDLSLFAERRFSFGILSGVGSYLVMFGVLLLIPFYVERGLGGGVARSGLELMALPLMFGLVAPLAGKLTDHFGARPLTVSGMSRGVTGPRCARPFPTGHGGDGWPLGLDRRRSGPFHFTEQCRHHGIRAPTTSRHGFGHLEHESRHGDRIGAGRDRADLFGERWGCGRYGRRPTTPSR